jgi:hypothetical protein
VITPSFALTATERVLPSMALDFTTASLDSRVTFTRSGNTATVVNSSGFIAPINANLPRFDYDPTTLVCKGLLIEEARTNICLQSNTFANIAWSNTSVTITANAAVSPDGTSNASLLTAAAADCAIFQTITVTTATAYVYSVYLRAATTTNISLYVDLNGLGSFVALPITVTTSWQRFLFPFTSTGVACKLYIGGGGSFGSPEAVYVYGVQLEAGAFATSFIPTTSAAVTRNADVAVMTSTNFSNWYTATTGAAVVWAIPQTATGTRPLVQFDDTTALKTIALRGNAADPELYIVNTTTQAQIDAGTIVANTAYKLSGAWNTNNCAAAKDGGTVGTDVVATIPAPTQLRIGSDGTNYACSWVQKVMYWKQRIIDAEVQAFSK